MKTEKKSTKTTTRTLGPYRDAKGGFKVVAVDKDGVRRTLCFDTAAEARRCAEVDEALARDRSKAVWAAALPLAEQGDVGALAVAMMLASGIRSSELLRLRVRDLADDGTVVCVDDRVMSVPEELGLLLMRLVDGRAAAAPLFALTNKALRAACQRVSRLAGLALRVTPSVLRHTFAAMAMRAAGSSTAVARALGHVDSGIGCRWV